MTKVVGDATTVVSMTGDEAVAVCRLRQGEKCCAFLVVGGRGFECVRMALYPSFMTIVTRLENGTMNAKGRGGWKGCAWEGEVGENDFPEKPTGGPR